VAIPQQTCVCSDMEIKNKVWQVAELEERRNILLLENQQLKENLSGFETKIWNLEKSGSSFSLNASAKVSFLGILYYTALLLTFCFWQFFP